MEMSSVNLINESCKQTFSMNDFMNERISLTNLIDKHVYD